MKFKIQHFLADGKSSNVETEVYFSLRVVNAAGTRRLVLRASNSKGDPGQDILVVREDGKVYRPMVLGKIEGLALNPMSRITDSKDS